MLLNSALDKIMSVCNIRVAIRSIRLSRAEFALKRCSQIVFILISLSTAGCVTISSGPNRIFDATAELPSLMAYANVPGNQTDKQSRNTFVAARMYAIDI
jgi:hypothetical protein